MNDKRDVLSLHFPVYVLVSPGLVPWEFIRRPTDRVFAVFAKENEADSFIAANIPDGFVSKRVDPPSLLADLLQKLQHNGFSHVAFNPIDSDGGGAVFKRIENAVAELACQ